MQYQLTPHSEAIEPFVWWEGAFTEDELDWLQNEARNASNRAQVGGGMSNEALDAVRRSNVSWLFNNPETNWVFERLAETVSKINARFYRLDLTGFGEGLQLTNYDQSEKGMYGWHQDYGTGISRKLSIVLQLSDPSSYEGGNLQVKTGMEDSTVRKQRGLITAFPSYALHQVTPVVQGNRQSLVAWVTGPVFK